jgi:DNA primase
VGEYVRLEKKGSRWVGLCPFHNEKTPSFGVNEERSFFYCFGCKKGGDAITFIKEIEKCGYVEALERLADKAGVIVSYEGDDDPMEIKAAKEKETLYELYERLAGTFQHFLLSDKNGIKALEYIKNRGFSDEIITGFRLGYAPKDRLWLHRFLKGKSYSNDFLSETGLFSKKYPQSAIFSDRLMFPIVDIRGRVIAFGGRIMSGDGPKYLNSPETSIFKKFETLFALHKAIPSIRSSGEVIICEGYMDAIAFHASGVGNAVAPLGTSFTDSQAGLLKRFAGTAILCFDSDEAGIKAAERAIAITESAGMTVRALRLDGAKDPAEILEKKGPGQLKKNAVSTITSDEFILENAILKLHEGGAQPQTVAFDYIFPYIATITSDIRRDSFISAAAMKLGADPASVRNDYERFRSNIRLRQSRTNQNESNVYLVSGSDAELIAAIVANPHLFESVRSGMVASDFETESLRDAFIVLEECYRSGNLSVSAITDHLVDVSLRNFILQRISDGAYAINPERLVMDGVSLLKERALERRKERVVARLHNFDQIRDSEEVSLDDLLYEKMHLDSELTRIKEERHGRT